MRKKIMAFVLSLVLAVAFSATVIASNQQQALNGDYELEFVVDYDAFEKWFVDPVTGERWLAVDYRLCMCGPGWWGVDILFTSANTYLEAEPMWICNGYAWEGCDEVNACLEAVTREHSIVPFSGAPCHRPGCSGRQWDQVTTTPWAPTGQTRTCPFRPLAACFLYSRVRVVREVCNSCGVVGATWTFNETEWRCR